KAKPEAIAAQKSLVDWWTGTAKASAGQDKTQVTAAGLHGGRQALIMTAAVPAIMFLCYLGLLAWFKTQGGYRATAVHDH
ncbi:MAG: hypothetical protein ACK557_14990, partial [Planctomycetota bacterium]